MATTAEDKAVIAALHESAKNLRVRVNDVQVDLSYQRNPSRDIYGTIGSDFDPVAAEQVLISDRGERPQNGKVKGGLWCVNGQHRCLGAKEAGQEWIEARVIDTSKLKDPGRIEAQLRLKTNFKLNENSLERFKAQVRAGDPDSLALQKLLARYDTQINTVPDTAYGINCVSAIETIYHFDEVQPGALLQDTLDLLKEIYEEIRGPVVSANIFRAYAWFIETQAEHVDRGRLVNLMQGFSIAQLVAKGRDHAVIHGNALWFNIYRAICVIYSEKLTQANKLVPVSRGATRISSRRGSHGKAGSAF